MAAQWGKETVGIESVDNQIESLEDRQETYSPDELQEILLWRLNHQDDPSYLDMLTKVYERGDLETIDEWINSSRASENKKARSYF